jgi:hypothetical protein
MDKEINNINEAQRTFRVDIDTLEDRMMDVKMSVKGAHTMLAPFTGGRGGLTWQALSLLRVFKQFTHLIPSGQMLSSFKTYSPLGSQCALWVSFECVLKEPVNIPIRQPFERSPRVLSQFVLNGPATTLSHSLRVFSKCAHNAAIIYSIIYSKGSLRVCGKIDPM